MEKDYSLLEKIENKVTNYRGFPYTGVLELKADKSEITREDFELYLEFREGIVKVNKCNERMQLYLERIKENIKLSKKLLEKIN